MVLLPVAVVWCQVKVSRWQQLCAGIPSNHSHPVSWTMNINSMHAQTVVEALEYVLEFTVVARLLEDEGKNCLLV